MTDDTGFDSMKAGERVSDMWLKLAEFIAGNVHVIAPDDPQKAIRYACCAEACYWKATGEADSHDVKDALALPSEEL